jgi:hypothetical protein
MVPSRGRGALIALKSATLRGAVAGTLGYTAPELLWRPPSDLSQVKSFAVEWEVSSHVPLNVAGV